jgi:hypothetical protein
MYLFVYNSFYRQGAVSGVAGDVVKRPSRAAGLLGTIFSQYFSCTKRSGHVMQFS